MTRSQKTAKRGELSQERFASSTALRKPILANLVARRCQTLSRAEDRELCWWVQELTMRDGFGAHFSCSSFPSWPIVPGEQVAGEAPLSRLAREICARFPDRLHGDQTKAIREIAGCLTRLCLDPDCDPRAIVCRQFDGLLAALHECKTAHSAAHLPQLADTKVARMICQAIDFALSQRALPDRRWP